MVEKEDKDNIVLIHKECSDKRREDFQKNFDKYSLGVGSFVKKCFNDNGETEHMWVKITSLLGDAIIGILDNEPISVKNVKYRDSVKVKFDEIV